MKDQPDATAPERTQTDASPTGDAPRLMGAAGGEAWTRGHVLLDDFVVMHLLGRGGMGEVYLVQSLLTQERYAVKRARVGGAAQRRKFLGELQIWIDLPYHPNLMQLRFARTVSEEMLLFTDHAEGGSLADWIRQHRLTDLPAALRLAVQLAQGVEAAHSANIVHQDVKPGNFLLTGTGEAKLSDFGLARARPVISAEDAIGLARPAGLTLAYCSPEQYARCPLGPQTDVWSLGLSILEVFTGGVIWDCGVEAPDALDSLLRNGRQRSDHAPMPAGLVDILRRCFALKPNDRWPSGAEVRAALSCLYEELLGESLPLSALSTGSSSDVPRPDKPLRPQVHLDRARKLAGCRVSEVGPTTRGTSLSQRAQMIEALSLYEEARTLLEGLPAQEDPAVQRAAAELFDEEGWAHLLAGDLPGASSATARAIARWEALLLQQRDPDIASNLLFACSHQGFILSKLQRSDLAHQHLERVRNTIVPVIRAEGWDHLTLHLPDLLMTDFSSRYTARDLRGALSVCDWALNVVSDLSGHLDRGRLTAAPSEERMDLERVCANFRHLGEGWKMNKACVLDDLQRHAEANAILVTVVDAREQRLALEGDTPAAVQDLALASCNQAMVLRNLQDQEGALRLLERAASLYDRLIEGPWPAEVSWSAVHGLTEARRERSIVAVTRSGILADMARFEEALALSARAIAWHEELVVDEGRMELGVDLSHTYQAHAEILASAGKHDESRALFEKSESMLRLLYVHHPSRVAQELALLYGKRALRLPGQAGATALDRERAISIYETQLEVLGRSELRPQIAALHLQEARDVAERGDPKAAEAALDRALELLKGEKPEALSRKTVIDWAEALERKANLHARRDEVEESLPYYHHAIVLLRPLCKGHRERWKDLALAHLNHGTALGRLQRLPEAARSYRRAASLFGLVCRDGDVEQVPFFIYACVRGASACFAMKQDQTGRALGERGVAAANEAVAQGRTLPPHLGESLALVRRKLREMRLLERNAGGIDMNDLLARAAPGGSMNRAVTNFFFCFRWEDKKQAALRHEDELLDPASLMLFLFMAEGLKDDAPDAQARMREAISIHVELLERCRREGIEAAFADRAGEARLRALGLLAPDEGATAGSGEDGATSPESQDRLLGYRIAEPSTDARSPEELGLIHESLQRHHNPMDDRCPCGSQRSFLECHGVIEDDT